MIQEQQAKSVHLDLVKKAVKTIKSSALEKVVLARALPCHFQHLIQWLHFIRCVTYNKAFVYWICHPKVVHGWGPPQNSYSMFGQMESLKPCLWQVLLLHESLWTAKEKKEQEVVTRFIENQVAFPF